MFAVPGGGVPAADAGGAAAAGGVLPLHPGPPRHRGQLQPRGLQTQRQQADGAPHADIRVRGARSVSLQCRDH